MPSPKYEKLVTEDILRLPDGFSEKLIIKQLLCPENADCTTFVAQSFKPEWLKDESSIKLFKLLRSYWYKYQSVPSRTYITTVLGNDANKDKCGEARRLVDEIYEIKESDFDKRYLQEAIVRYTKGKAIYFTIFENLKAIEDSQDINCCFERFEEIAKYDLNTDLGIEYFSNIENHIERLKQKDTKTSTGLKGVDDVTYGGLPVNDTCLMLYMAKPGLGKSMFMANLAVSYLLQNKKVLLFTLEMSEHMYSMRIDSIISELNINRLPEATDTLRKRVNALKLGVSDAMLRIKEFPTGTCCTSMIKQFIKNLREQSGFVPDLVIVDYLNIMKANSAQANQALYEKGKATAEELRALSGELKVPVVSAVQSNRSNTNGSKFADKAIDMENTAESAGIPATADLFFGIFQQEGDRDAGKINLKVVKNRFGGYVGNSIPVAVDYNCMKLTDWDGGSVLLEDLDGNAKSVEAEKTATVEKKIEKDKADLSFAIDQI